MIKSKKHIYCCNCNRKGHVHRTCKEPITSYGIITISLNINQDVKNKFIEYIKNNFSITNELSSGIECNNIRDVNLFSTYKHIIKFLMVKSKYTVGYIEFIRGKYKSNNTDNIIFLFQQMTLNEIKRIKNSSFDDMWKDLWIFNNDSFNDEYISSKNKFEKLRNGEDVEINLNFYIENIKPKWDHAEWGFPKGRKNIDETDLMCAVREFKEETGLNDDDFFIVNTDDKNFAEEFIGTNNVTYKHVYYFGFVDNNKQLSIDKNNCHQYGEIGDIQYLNYENAINLIRPHHKNRIDIITYIYVNLMKLFISFVNNNDI